MSQKSDYTEAEWTQLVGLSVLIPVHLLKSGISPLSIIRKIKEVAAYTASRTKIVEKYPDNSLIKDIFSNLNADNQQVGDVFKECIEDRAALSNLIKEVNEVLIQKSDDTEAGEYKAAIYQYATEIASASGDGFFGGGAKINTQEAEFLHALKQELLGNL